MTRPAVIIGLGGTGEWVVTLVKKDLLEIGNGKMPANVHLLAFDLMPHGEAAVKGAGAAVAAQEPAEQQRAQVGQVKLRKDIEFIDLGGNIYELSQAIAAEERAAGPDRTLRHLASWFQAADYLNALPPAEFDLCTGAGQVRQFGRMAVFEDLTHGNRELSTRIMRAMNDLQAEVRDTNVQLEVIIVASFAGGTGAGMLIDVANLARQYAGKVMQHNYVIRGFIVLPDAFPWTSDHMKARAFAAWRELDRFMLINKEEGLGLENILYNEELSVPVETWPFDGVYLAGGDRPHRSLQNMRPESGVFPSVAGAISAILDGVAGEHFTRQAANLRPVRLNAGKADIPLYSGVGAYTIKVPVYYAEQTFRHQLALEALQTLVPLQTDPQGNVIGLKPDVRPDKPREAGTEEVPSFLGNQPVTAGEVSVSNTLLTPQMREILSATGAHRQQAINDYAQFATGEGGGASTILSAFTTQLPESLGENLKQIQNACEIQLVQEVLPSWDYGDSTFDAINRYQGTDKGGVKPFVKRYYGYLDDDSTDYRGELGDNLEVCKKEAHLSVFKKRLRTWLQGTLKGDSGDPHRDLDGRLGYAIDFARGLNRRLEEFQKFIGNVVKERSRLGLVANALGDEANALQYLIDHPKIRWWSRLGVAGVVAGILIVAGLAAGAVILFLSNPMLWWTFPIAGAIILGLALAGIVERDNTTAEAAYLEAVQARINERKADIIYNVVHETVGDMRGICSQCGHELTRWAQALALGDPQGEVQALLSQLEDDLNRTKATWQADERLGDQQRHIEIEADPTSEDVAAVLDSISWEVEPDCDLAFRVTGADGTVRSVALEPDGTVDPSLLLEAASRQFTPRIAGKRIAAVLRQAQTAKVLAEELHDRSEPLYRPAPAAVRGQPLGSTHMVRVKHDVDAKSQAFFDNDSGDERDQGVIQWLRSTLTHNVELVGSEDEYKLTAVRTDDLMESGYFDQYRDCRQAYINHIQGLARDKRDPEEREQERIRMVKRLHLFPALVNAVEYEVRLMADQDQLYRPLHTKVVSLLEDKERFRQFFLLHAYGFLVETVGEDAIQRWYELQLPGTEPLFLTRPAPGSPDIFRAINTFTITRQDARPDRTARINDQAVSEAIRRTQRDLVGAIYRLRQARDNGLARQLAESQNEARGDLGSLARLMYKEWVGYLRVSSPRVVALLELEGTARQRLTQFFGCIAYGIIEEEQKGTER